jgi:hypothetical protein
MLFGQYSDCLDFDNNQTVYDEVCKVFSHYLSVVVNTDTNLLNRLET